MICSIVKDTRKEQGVVLIELALVVGILVLLIFGTIEIARVLRVFEVASFLSREAATSTLVETAISEAEYSAASDQLAAFSNNLRESLLSLQVQSNNIVSGTEIIINRYYLNNANTVESRTVNLAQLARDSGITGIAVPKRTTRSTVNNQTITNGKLNITLSNTRKYLVIAEVFVPCEIIVPGIARMIGINNGVYYDATVL